METAVYLVTEDGRPFFKIGVAADPKRRIKELQTGNPRQLEIGHIEWFPTRQMARTVERAMHANFATHAAKGEWFGADLVRAYREFASFAIFVRSGGDPSNSPSNVATTHWALNGHQYPAAGTQ